MDAMRWDLSGIAVVEQLDHLYTFPLLSSFFIYTVSVLDTLYIDTVCVIDSLYSDTVCDIDT